jgi:hypothetical protein
MKTTILITLAASFGFLLMSRPAEAHHSWLDFDPGSEVTHEATVTDFHFTNPHCVVEFTVKDEKGQVFKWQGEFSSPGALGRKGWTASSLQPGDKIVISGHPAKDKTLAMHVTKMRMPDGEERKIEGGR